MKRLLFGVAAAALFAAFTPANAQVYMGAGPDGVGVQVGPLGAGIGPDWRGRRDWRDDYAYVPDCRIVRERFVTPRGHVIYRSHRECD